MKKLASIILALSLFLSLITGVQLSSFAATSSEREKNDSYETANSLAVGDTITGNLSSNSDDDYFKFVLPSDGKVNIKFTNQTAECSDYFIIDVYKYAGSDSYEHIARSDVDGSKYLYCRDISSYSFPSLGLPKGTYYINISGDSEKHLQYGLTVNYTSVTNWETEYNEDFETADSLNLGETKYGTLVRKNQYGSYDYERLSSDDDYYKFVLPSDGKVNIEFTNQTAECSDYFIIDVYKYAGSDSYEHIARSDVDGSKYLYCRDISSYSFPSLGLPKGTYYINISGDSEKHLQYGLTVNYTSVTNWETEYNEDFETADSLNLGETKYGTLVRKNQHGSYDYERLSSDDDYFKFKIDTKDIYNISLKFAKKSTDNYWKLTLHKYISSNNYDNIYDSDNIYQRDVSAFNTGTLNLTPGTYYVQVYGDFEKFSDSQYGITVSHGVGNASGLKVSKRTTTSLKLAWKAAQKASGYEIQKMSKGKWKAVATTAKTAYVIKKLTAGAVYDIRVRAYRNTKYGKVYSSWKTIKQPTTPETVNIKTPSTNSKHQITVKWKAVTRASGYQVEFAKDKAFKNVIASKYVSGKAKTSYTGNNFTKGNTYYVRVRAYKTVDGKKYYGSYSSVKSIKSK